MATLTNIDLHYPSVEALLASAQDGTLSSHSVEHTTDTFAGCATFADAVDLYEQGWTPGMDWIKATMESMDLPNVDLSRVRTRPDVAGGSVDIGRFVVGDPECMRRITMAPGRPIVRIAVCGGYAWHHDVETILANGAPIIALCDLLGAAGFGVEIDTVNVCADRSSGKRRRYLRTVVNVKRANQPIDLGSFAFAIAHPAYFRRFTFGAWETDVTDSADRSAFMIPGGYGYQNCEAEMHAYCAEQGYDVDLTGYPVPAEHAVDRVMDAVTAWADRVMGNDDE